MTTLQVTVVGSVNLDFTAAAPKLPSPGETVTDAVLTRHPGGKGANQALAARRLGAAVKLIARVGRDAMADEALRLLQREGVDLTECGIEDGASTGVALIAVDPSGENQIVVAPGANSTLRPEHMRRPIEGALICQLETPEAGIAHAVRLAPGFICLNLAPARPVDPSLLQKADLIVVNQIEAAFYGEALHRSGALIARTAGAKGAELFRNGRLAASVEAPRIRAVDATGAGDAFVAALTLALIEGRPKDQALSFACTAGAITAMRPGAQTSLPTREEVNEFLSAQR
jgi:ribokinase